MMLASLGLAIAVPYHALLPESGRVCMSTATYLKTAECNLDCNGEKLECPEDCMCAPGNASTDLRFGLPAESFARLIQATDRQTSVSSSVPAAALLRRLQAETATVASLPKEMVGSCEATPRPR